ncbi:MAG: hypothetical protein B5M53_10145 [Candidatus Cloacimonas sp. 4484_209]|nr:MAG: hypothetical protein B5M53_10145 [Candidatus Cloacimonas sp. 4484_209]
MSLVRPFRGLRPKPEFAEKVASPPYDVLSSEEARKIVEDNPYSFLHIVKPEVDLDPSIDLYDERVYKKAKENLARFINDGILIQDNNPCFYIYSQKMGEHTQTGLVTVASVDEYEAGVIKKHENTRLEKEIDRANHIKSLNAQAGPVFLTYRADSTIDTMINKAKSNNPIYDFVAEDGVRHIFFVVDDRKIIEEIVKAFKGIDYLYVADGHHRSAAAARVRDERRRMPNFTREDESNYFLTVIFPHNQMFIMDYNRVVVDLNGLSVDEFLKRVGERFTILEYSTEGKPYKPDKPHNFGMYLNSKWYHLSAKEEIIDNTDAVLSLDVSILQNNLLAPILGIKEPRKDKRISFVGGIRGLGELEKLVDSHQFTVAFSMFPTTIEQLMAVADAGRVMPPKSTWFEPKLRSGLITHLLS